jgi:glycosyltransferase involved in cell wall biosynthesis
MTPAWTVSQIGARQHYAIPVGFQRRGQLTRLYTDVWAGRARHMLARGPGLLRAFAGRFDAELPPSKVVAFTGRALLDQLVHRRSDGRSMADTAAGYLRVGRWFAGAVAADLARRTLDPAVDAFLGFNTGCLETLIHLRGRGVVTVCDQIDPAQVEDDLVRAEANRWPGWQRLPGRMPDAYWDRMRQEWAAADRVLVNSDWSRDALVRQGVPAEKLFVVPVAYEPAGPPPPPRQPVDGPLTVLWLGTVNLRKGIPYLIDAARRLPMVRFVVAGSVQIADSAVRSAPSNVTFVGPVARTATADLYRRADLFVLPTISDGFAVTQVEAMGHGLPVVTTPNCGRVVTDGIDGRIVPAGDAEALATALGELDADRPRLAEMSRRAIERSRQFGLDMQSQMIDDAVEQLRVAPPQM